MHLWFYPQEQGEEGGRDFGIPLTPDEIRHNFVATVMSMTHLFNIKQDERGPDNVTRLGADGILTQIQERIERVRASLIRGTTPEEELRLNALDIAVFGVILTMALDGTWESEDGRKPSLLITNVAGAAVPQDALADIIKRLEALEAKRCCEPKVS